MRAPIASSFTRRFERALIVLFVAALCAPSVDSLVRHQSWRAIAAEQRNVAPRPLSPASLDALIEYPVAFEAWFNDVYGLRPQLVRCHNLLKWCVFGVSPTRELIRGKDNWVFLTADRSIPLYRGIVPFSQGQLEAWRRSLESRQDYCRRHGCEFLYAIAPNKTEAYGELMLERFDRVGPTRLDQLVAYLHEHSTLQVLDLRSALNAEKRNDQPGDYTFGPLGSHWTARGAYAASCAMVERLQQHFPLLRPLARERLRWQQNPRNEGDSWAARMYLGDVLHQKDRIISEIEGSQAVVTDKGSGPINVWRSKHLDQSLPHLLVFHDSFGEAVRPCLAESFATTTMVWRSDFQPDVIEAEHPDIVMQLFLERRLAGMPPTLELSGREHELEADFNASRDVRLHIDGCKAPRELVARGATQVTQQPDGLAIFAPGTSDTLALPAFEFPRGRTLILRLDLTSPRALLIELAFTTLRDPQYQRLNVYRIAPAEGRAVTYFEVMEPDMAGRWLLRPYGSDSPFVLHELEVRAVER